MKLTDVPTTILVASGKGGVGKTQVSVDLAKTLASKGHTVGFFDADISTPNAPEALAGEDFTYDDQPLSDGRHLLPVEADGVHVYSQGLELRDDVALLHDDAWRAEAMENYVHTIEWPNDMEFLVVDSPPGNGSEVQLVIAETDPTHGFLITTGATHSARDTRRTHELFKEADVPHSVIANMRVLSYPIPYEELQERVQEVSGVAETKAMSITEIARDVIGDGVIPLHDDDIDLEEWIGSDVVADVPFTPDADKRQAALQPALDVIPQPTVVK